MTGVEAYECLSGPDCPDSRCRTKRADSLRATLIAWDFDHSKNRPKVYVDSRWQNECRCGRTFLTMSEWEQHRFDMGVDAVTSVRP
jgi:hypothetical protein